MVERATTPARADRDAALARAQAAYNVVATRAWATYQAALKTTGGDE